jgi:putative glutamine amidotransferase
VSNVAPAQYEDTGSDCPPLDPDRDATTLPLIRLALAVGMPMLAICRGLQELNVALGGSLHAQLHRVLGRHDHRAPAGQPHEVQYAPRHPVRLAPGGLLAGLTPEAEIMVNSLHGQAIDRLGAGLLVEATAFDGTIEAIRVADAKSFALGVQWHPEWRFAEEPLSQALFAAFTAAVRQHQAAGTTH